MTENYLSEVTLHCMKIKMNAQVMLKPIQEVIFDLLLIADSGHKIPLPPLHLKLLRSLLILLEDAWRKMCGNHFLSRMQNMRCAKM